MNIRMSSCLAYREAAVFVSCLTDGVGPSADLAMVRHQDMLPPDVQDMLGRNALPIGTQIDYLQHQFKHHRAGGTLHWAIAPFAPQRCTPKMLEALC